MDHFEALDGKVEILYDGTGVPHIRATTQNDVYFAQGYVLAEARRWQMDLYRRTATGRLAECFGGSALAGDRFQRSLRLSQLAAVAEQRLSAPMRTRLEAYAAGVNAYTDKHGPPPEFALVGVLVEPWSIMDSLVIAELRSIINASWRADLIRMQTIGRVGYDRARVLFPDQRMPDDSGVVFAEGTLSEDDFEEFLSAIGNSEDALRLVGLQHSDTGTNTWVVNGDRSETGHPLLANDLHMGYVAPNPNFIIHLCAPELNVRGICFPGFPGVIVGHNEHIAWGAATFMSDTQDVFLEEFNDSGTEYRSGDDWLPVDEATEVIAVKGAGEEMHTTLATHHGPIIDRRGKWGLALCWERLDCAPADLSFHAVNTAQTWEQFRDALRDYTGAANDFTFADRDGNIGVQTAGHIPIRRSGDGSLPALGRSDSHDWTGFISFDDLPSVFNPDSGQIVRSNQNHLPDDSIPHVSHRWHPPYRARRIRDLLQIQSRHSVAGFAQIQFDRYSIFSSRVVERILASVDDTVLDSIELEALAQLREWDMKLDPDSAAASIAKEVCSELKERILQPVLGKLLLLLYQSNWPASNCSLEMILDKEMEDWLPDDCDCFAALYVQVFRAAVARLRSVFDDAPVRDWSWGSLHKAYFPHPLDRLPASDGKYALPSLEVGGDGECVFSSRSVGDFISARQRALLAGDDSRAAIFGTSARMIYDLADLDNSSILLNLGQSGDPESEHYSDQAEAWQRGETRRLPFSWSAVEAAAARRLELGPEHKDDNDVH